MPEGETLTRIVGRMIAYLRKMRGGGKRPRRASLAEIFVAWVGALLAVGMIAFLDRLTVGSGGPPLLVASFGASSVLVFGAIKSPFAQPRNLVGGHVLSALVGVTMGRLLPEPLWLCLGLTAASAIAVMHLTKTLHPPGGATALIAIIGGEKIRALGYWYVLTPCCLGALIMLLVAVVINNIPRTRRYPQYW